MTPSRHMVRGEALLLPILLVAALATSRSEATVVRRMALPEMVGRAEAVVHARAIENSVHVDPESSSHFTVTTFQVLEKAKGALRPGDLVEIEIPGGRSPSTDYETIVAAAPRFTVGEEVVLFTSPGARGHKFLVGFFQGAVRLRAVGGGLVVPSAPPQFIALNPGDRAPLMASTSTAVDRDGTPITTPLPVPAPTPERSGQAKERNPVVTMPSGGAAGSVPTAGTGVLTLTSFLERVRQIDATQGGGGR